MHGAQIQEHGREAEERVQGLSSKLAQEGRERREWVRMLDKKWATKEVKNSEYAHLATLWAPDRNPYNALSKSNTIKAQ